MVKKPYVQVYRINSPEKKAYSAIHVCYMTRQASSAEKQT